MEQLADLLKQLDAIPEGDGTMLDNTCVLYGNCMSFGSHPTKFLPFVRNVNYKHPRTSITSPHLPLG